LYWGGGRSRLAEKIDLDAAIGGVSVREVEGGEYIISRSWSPSAGISTGIVSFLSVFSGFSVCAGSGCF